jgi:hypothetical protein
MLGLASIIVALRKFSVEAQSIYGELRKTIVELPKCNDGLRKCNDDAREFKFVLLKRVIETL